MRETPHRARGRTRVEPMTSIRRTGEGLLRSVYYKKALYPLACTMLLIGLIQLPQARAGELKVTESFESPSLVPLDLAWDGEYLWEMDGYIAFDYIIRKIDPETGDLVKNIMPIHYKNTGLTWDGEYLWVTNLTSESLWVTNNWIHAINPENGYTVDSIDSPGRGVGGLTWDGEHFWTIADGLFYAIDPESENVVNSFDSPGRRTKGLAWNEGFLWIVEGYRIHRIDPLNGAIIETFSSPASPPFGITWGENCLWINGDGNIYRTKVFYYLSTSIGSGSGSIKLSPPGGIYEMGTTVTVTVDPDPGYRLDNWAGDVSGTSDSIEVEMNSDKGVIANFTKKPSESAEPSGVKSDGGFPWWLLLIYLLISTCMALWVYQDSQKRKMNRKAWAGLTLLTSIVGLGIYLEYRERGPTNK